MPEISSEDAARLIGLTRQSIRAHVEHGRLAARRVGPRRVVKIELDDLRQFARQYQYTFNETLASQLAK